MELTPRERLLRALGFEEVDMIPPMLPYFGSLGQFGSVFLQDETIPEEKRQSLAQEMANNPRSVSLFMYLSLPKTRLPWNRGHLSKRSPSPRASSSAGGMGLTISSKTVERLALRK